MPTATREKQMKASIVVSVLSARANLGKLLQRVDTERCSLVIEKRGAPRAVLLSIRDYVKLAAPEPEVLRLLGEESERKGTNSLTVARSMRSSRPHGPGKISPDAAAARCDRYKRTGLRRI